MRERDDDLVGTAASRDQTRHDLQGRAGPDFEKQERGIREQIPAACQKLDRAPQLRGI